MVFIEEILSLCEHGQNVVMRSVEGSDGVDVEIFSLGSMVSSLQGTRWLLISTFLRNINSEHTQYKSVLGLLGP